MAEEKPKKLPGPTFTDEQGNTYKATLVGANPEMFSQDVTLDDGTVLRVRVLIVGVLRAEGVTDANGAPLYHVQTAILPTVKGTN